MPFIAIPDSREAWTQSWTEIRDTPDSRFEDGRIIITHPDESKPRPALSDRAAAITYPVPTDVFMAARKAAGDWGGAVNAYAILAPHLPAIKNPLDHLSGLSKRRQARIKRKCASVSGMLSPRDHARVTRALVDSVSAPQKNAYGAETMRHIRDCRREREDRELRKPDETLWEFFTRKFNRGTRPRDLPSALDVPGQFVGVELEFVPPLDPPDENDEDSCHVSLLPYDAAPFGSEYHHDGSVRTGDGLDEEIDGPTEAVILLRPPRWIRLHKLCVMLLQAGCRVNDTCGVHIHVDVRHLQESDQLLKRVTLLVDSLPVLATRVKLNRVLGPRSERYCRFGVSPRFGDPSEHYTPYRYWAVNLCAVQRQGTVEFRLLHGSLNPVEIEGWATLVRYLLLEAERPLLTETDLASTCAGIGLTSWLERLRVSGPGIERSRQLLSANSYDWGAYDEASGRAVTLHAFRNGGPPPRETRRHRVPAAWRTPAPAPEPPAPPSGSQGVPTFTRVHDEVVYPPNILTGRLVADYETAAGGIAPPRIISRTQAIPSRALLESWLSDVVSETNT